MTKLFLKHFAKHVAGVAAIFAVMSGFAWAGDYFFGHHLYGMLAFVVLGLLFWMADASWQQAKRDNV